MTKDQSLDALNWLFLTDRETLTDNVISSDIEGIGSGFHLFETMNIETGERQVITFRIEKVSQ